MRHSKSNKVHWRHLDSSLQDLLHPPLLGLGEPDAAGGVAGDGAAALVARQLVVVLPGAVSHQVGVVGGRGVGHGPFSSTCFVNCIIKIISMLTDYSY